ncbi:MAG: hypothetical protein J5545_02140 [Bacteroidaceae bacterium]|nr:hypothetical protein [Bacteroidaceae bacterium]
MAAMVGMGVNAQTWTGNEVAEGSFFFYNVGTGTYLCGGNDWGTHASVSEWGVDFTLKGENDVYTMDSQISNGGDSHFLAGAWTDGAATNWTFVKVSETPIAYTLNNGSGFLAATGNGTYVDVVEDGTTNNAKWVLVSRADIVASLKNATEDNPADATLLVPAADPGRNNLRNSSWKMTKSGGNQSFGGDNTNFAIESWNNTFEVSQTITDIPNGLYKVSCYGYGSNGTTYIFGNNVVTPFVNTTTSANFTEASKEIRDGQHSGNISDMVTVTANSITIGVKRDSQVGADWAVFDKFNLIYYGIDLDALRDALQEQIDAVAELEGTTTPAAYAAAKACAEGITVANLATEEEISAAAAELAAKVNAAEAMQEPYARYKGIKAAVLEVDETIDVAAADALADAALTAEELEKAIVAIRGALSAYLIEEEIEDDQIDLTDALIDNAAPYASTQYWTVTNGDGNPANANAVDAGNKCAEFWNQKGFTLKQTLASTLPAGYYNLTAVALTREGMVGTLFAGENTAAIATVAKATVNNRGQANTWFNEGNGVTIMTFELPEATEGLTIGLTADNTTSDYWTVWRSFELTYLGTTPLGILSDQVQDVIEDVYTFAENAEEEETLPAGVIEALAGLAEEIEYAKDDYTEVQQFLDAKDALEAAIEDAKVAVKNYAAYNALLENATELVLVDNDNENANAEFAEVIMSVDNKVEAATEAAEIEKLTAELKEAMTAYITEANPVGEDALFDCTFLLTNPDLTGLGNGKKDGWFTDQNEPVQNSQAMVTNTSVANTEDPTLYAMYEYWSNGTEPTEGYTVYLKVNLPEGTYKMTALAFTGFGGGHQYGYRTDGDHELGPKGEGAPDITFSAGDVDGTAITTATLEDAAIDFVQAEEGEVKIGLRAHANNKSNWMGLGYVKLYKAALKSIIIDEAADFEPASMAANVTLKRTFKADVWNTFVVPFQITNEELTAAFGADVKVAEFSEVPNAEVAGSSTINFNVMETPAITPNKPVLIKTAVEAIEAIFENRTIAAGEAKIAGTNVDFVGTYDAATEIAAGDYFISANKLFKSTGATTIQGTRAYVAAKADGEVKLFIDGIETAISDVNGLAIENGAIFNLAGQRVSKAQKGIFILNGKKVVR